MMNLDFETEYWRNSSVVVGVDEVGRGCLAGPVVVGAVVFPQDHVSIEGVNDSKKVSAKKRELLEPVIREQALAVGIGQVEAAEIDEIGIVTAISKAADLALEAMKLKMLYAIVSDGPRPIHSPLSQVESVAVIDGDALIYSVAAASIVAKVYRDTLMQQQAELFPEYDWLHNVGYGTKKHREAIIALGLTSLHRHSFCKRY